MKTLLFILFPFLVSSQVKELKPYTGWDGQDIDKGYQYINDLYQSYYKNLNINMTTNTQGYIDIMGQKDGKPFIEQLYYNATEISPNNYNVEIQSLSPVFDHTRFIEGYLQTNIIGSQPREKKGGY
jgi:hypothetical protein